MKTVGNKNYYVVDFVPYFGKRVVRWIYYQGDFFVQDTEEEEFLRDALTGNLKPTAGITYDYKIEIIGGDTNDNSNCQRL